MLQDTIDRYYSMALLSALSSFDFWMYRSKNRAIYTLAALQESYVSLVWYIHYMCAYDGVIFNNVDLTGIKYILSHNFSWLWDEIVDYRPVYEYADEITKYVRTSTKESVITNEMDIARLVSYVNSIFGISRTIKQPVRLYLGWLHKDNLDIKPVLMEEL